MAQKSPTRVLILGGGFGGVYAALEFEKILSRDSTIEVTLINRENFFLFTPMLHEVAASDLDMTAIVNPIRKLLKRVRFFHGSVQAIDLDARSVTVCHSDDQHAHTLAYDHLVLALGSVTNFFNLPGLEQHARTMKSLGDAISLRNHLIELLEAADFECAVGLRDHLLTVVVAGGGFAGVETIAAVNDFLRESIRFYPHLSKRNLRILLVEAAKAILPELGQELGSYACQKLLERGVEIRLNTGVAGVSSEGIQLTDGECVPSKTLVWTAGTSPNPLLGALPCAKERGRVVVSSMMEVSDRPGIWALGDCALVPDPRTGKPYPPTAQHAIRQGRVLARNIVAAIHGGEKKPFVFSTLGQLAAIGRRTGVARIFGLRFSGFIAWWLWRSIYLSKLPRFEKKVRVALDWSLDLMFSKDLVQFDTGRSDSTSLAAAVSPPSERAAAVGSINP